MWRTTSRREPVPLGVTRLEDRTVPASTITITVGANGSGSLDGFLFDATPGTIAAADGGTAPGTLSTGALAAVSPTIDINVRAQGNLTFNDLGGTLTLPTGPGHTASFGANPGSITVANAANTLATSGGGLFLSALANVAAFNLNSAGGNVGLSTSSAGTTLTARSIQAGAGSVNVSNGGTASASVSQTGTVVGGDILFTGGSGLSVDDLRGARVNLQSTAGSVNSVGANPIQATTQLILVAENGITVNTLAAGIAAVNHTSGNISITQAASPARALATLPAIGIANQAPGGSITVTNLGDAISVASGATVVTNNGPITLAAADFNIGAAINSGTARTTLANSTAGRPFDLGTDAVGKVGLTAAELTNVTAGVLQVGSTTAGAITVSAAITAPTGWNTLTLLTGNTFTQAGGSLKVPRVRLSSGGTAAFSNQGNANTIGTLAADFNGQVLFLNAGPLTIGTVDGKSGFTDIAGTISLVADNLAIQQPINAGTNLVHIQPLTGTTQLDVGGADAAGVLGLTDAELGLITAGQLELGSGVNGANASISSAITRHAGYSTLELDVAGTLTQTATLSVANLSVGSNGSVTLNLGNDVDVLAGRVIGAANNFSFADANSLAIGRVGSSNGIILNGGTIAITTGADITDGNGPDLNVSGTTLSGTAGGTIDLDVDVSAIASLNAGRPITLTEAGTANIFGISSSGGTITLDGGTFNLAVTNGVGGTSTLNIAGAIFNLQAFSDTVFGVRLTSGSIVGSGILTSTNGFDVRGGSVSAPLGGSGGLTKTTPGIVTLSGAHTYTGTTTVSGGTLVINGSLPAGSPVSVSGGTLGGIGTVGAMTASFGAIAPGNSPGLLTANGNVSFGSNAAFVAEVNGATAGAQYDQLKVNGTVSLGGAPLNLFLGGGFVPFVGTQFVLIDNDGSDPVSGTFNGLPQGAALVVAGQRFTISYAGGTGNDVVLTKAPVAVQSVVIDDGTAQRSMVRSVTVTFEGQVAFAGPVTNAFQLARTGPGGPTGPVTLSADTSGSTANQTVARLTFTGPLTGGANSLIDGSYTLTVLSGQVQGGVQGGDNVSTLFRLFGDIDGNRAVNGLDLTAFRNAFGSVSTDASYVPYLDFDGNGAINGTDLTQFRNRFGVILP